MSSARLTLGTLTFGRLTLPGMAWTLTFGTFTSGTMSMSGTSMSGSGDVDVGAGLKGSVLKGTVSTELLTPGTGRCRDGKNRPDRSGNCSDARCDDKCTNHVRTPKNLTTRTLFTHPTGSVGLNHVLARAFVF